MDFNHGFGLGEAGLRAGQLLLEAGMLGHERILRHGLGATGLGGEPCQGTLIAELPPLGHVRGGEPVAAQIAAARQARFAWLLAQIPAADRARVVGALAMVVEAIDASR